MNILALDLGKKFTGWAHSGGTSGVKEFKKRAGDSPGIIWIDFKAWLYKLINEFSYNSTRPYLDLIVYEQAHHQGAAATHAGHGLIACVEEVATARRIELTVRHSATIKSHAIGKGKGRNRSKEAMVRAAVRRWPELEIIDDNHADALFLLSLVQSEGLG